MTYHSYAHKVISVYLKKVLEHQKGVRWHDDIEELHQLRTNTRRLRNALWVFQDVMQPSEYDRWNKKVRKLTRATGHARDLDVYIEFIQTTITKTRVKNIRAGLEEFLEFLKDKRERKQEKVLKQLDKMEKQKTWQSLDEFIKAIAKTKGAQSIAASAEKSVGQRLDELLIMKANVYHANKVDELHQLRIAAKHVRYSMECFHDYYGKGLEKYINGVIPLQRVLGSLHDYDVWLEKIPKVLKISSAFAPARAYLQKHIKRLRADTYKQMVRIWEDYERKKYWDKIMGFLKSKETKHETT